MPTNKASLRKASEEDIQRDSMQTFLPYDDFKKSVMCLDYKRLGKQRVEAMQILNILLGRTDTEGWRNHPAVLMWKGYEEALKEYYNTAVSEWKARGFKNNMELEKIEGKPTFPPWFGSATFHASHRSNLLRKDPDYYGVFGWKEPTDLPYVWPESKAG